MAMESTVQRHSFISVAKQSLWCSMFIGLDKRNNLSLKAESLQEKITAPTPELWLEASRESASEGGWHCSLPSVPSLSKFTSPF